MPTKSTSADIIAKAKKDIVRLKLGGSFFEDPKRPGSFVHKWAGGRVRGATWAACLDKRFEKEQRAHLVPGSVADVCDGWLVWVRDDKGDKLAGNTDAAYARSVERIKAGLGEDTPIAGVTFRDIEVMLLTLAKPPHNWRRDSLLALLGHLRRVCRHAVREGMMTSNPCDAVELPERAPRRERKRQEREGVKLEGKDKANFTLEEFGRVRDYLTTHHSAVDRWAAVNTMFLVMLDCGLRPAEAWGLRWDCVDFTGRRLWVESTVSLGRDRRYATTDTLKTDHKGHAAHRVVPMTSGLAAALAELKLVQGQREFVFHGWAGICRSTLETGAARICREAGVPRGTAYCFRHTFASVAIHSRKFSYKQIATMMGHRDERMLIGYYSGDVADVTAEELDGAFTT